MKLIFAFTAAILTLLSTVTAKSHSKNKYFITPLIKSAKSFLSFANLPYCNQEIINTLACPLCSDLLDKSYKVDDIQVTVFEKRVFKVVILKSHSHREIVVAFGGPKLGKDAEFYSAVFSLGYEQIHNVHVEQVFAKVYNGNMQAKLTTRLQSILKQKAHKNYKIIFVGHSFGGALATLAAFDLLESKAILPSNQPKVYTYGQLKIGHLDFVTAVNKKIEVIRIIKNTDLTPMLQNCQYNKSLEKWDCSKEAKSAAQAENSGPKKVSPADESKRYYPGTFNMVYGGKPVRSFLEKESKQVDMYYGGLKNNAYYRTTDDVRSFWQPIGSEVVFSKSFKKYQICSYTNGGNGKCEMVQHKYFDAKENNSYFRKRVDKC